MNLAEFRTQFPQYDDIADSDLVARLHGKYYSDIPLEKFSQTIGYTAELTEAPRGNTAMPKVDALKALLEQAVGVFTPSPPEAQAQEVAPEAPAELPAPALVAPTELSRAHLPGSPEMLVNALQSRQMAQAHPAPGRATPMPLGDVGETAAQLISGLVSTGAAGLSALSHGIGASEGGALLNMPPPDLQEISRQAQEAGARFQLKPPVDEYGKPVPPGPIQKAVSYPFEKISEFGANLTKEIYENGLNITDPETGNVVNQFKGNSFMATMLGVAPDLFVAASPFLGRIKATPGKAVVPFTAADSAEAVSTGTRLRNILKTEGQDAFRAAFEEELSKRGAKTTPEAPAAEAPEAAGAAQVPEVVKPAPIVATPDIAPVAPALAQPALVLEAPKAALPQPVTPAIEAPPAAPPTINEIIAKALSSEPGLSKAEIAVAPKPVPLEPVKTAEKTIQLDEDTEAHFQAWLDRTIPIDDQAAVEKSMRQVMTDNPELVEQGKSWGEIRRMAEGQEPAIPKPERPAKTRTSYDKKLEEQRKAYASQAEGASIEQLKETLSKIGDTSNDPADGIDRMRKEAIETELSRRQAQPKAKEPWEMTSMEFYQSPISKKMIGKMGPIAGSIYSGSAKPTRAGKNKWFTDQSNKLHEQSVRQAVREGKPVRAEVLADYPDLAKVQQAETKPVKPAVKSKVPPSAKAPKITTMRGAMGVGAEAMSEAALKPPPATSTPNAPTVFTKPIPKGQTRSATLKKVEEILGVPIRVGKYRARMGGANAVGIYKGDAKVIRLQKANDIEVAAHEVGHHVQDLLGLGGKMPKEVQAMAYAGAKDTNREGFAEFMRYYIVDPKKVAAEAPAFLKTFDGALANHTDVADALTRIKQSWNTWQAAPPVAKVLSVIQRGKEKGKRYSFDELYRDTVDELHPLKMLSDAVKGKTGEALEITKDPFMLAWLNRGWARKADQMIKYGTFQIDEAKGVRFTGPSLREILAPVEKAGRMEMLDAYLVAKRAVSDERIIKGFDRIISKEDFEKTVKELEPEFKEVADQLYKFNDELLTYLVDAGRISEEVAKAIREKNLFYAPFYRVMDDAPPQGGLSKKKYDSIFNPIKRLKGSSRDIVSPTESILKNTYAMINAAERNRVGKAMLDITEIEGMGDLVEKIPFPLKPDKINKDDFLKLLRQWGEFKSIANVERTQTETEKVISDVAAAGKKASSKMVDVAMEALKSRGWSDGEARQVISRIQNADTPQSQKEIVERTVEKTVIMTIKEELSLANMPDQVIFTFRPDYRAGPNEAIFYDHGKPVLVELEPMLARAIKGLDADGVNILTKILSYPAKWLRAGATLTPEFMARNPMRDQMTAWIYTKYGYKPGWDLIRGIAHIIGKTELYQKYNASGAAHASLVSLDREYLSKTLKEITRMQTAPEMIRNPVKAVGRVTYQVVRHPLETLQIFSELTEEATRVGEFSRAYKKEGGDFAALMKGGVAARDITLDFSRIGLKTRSMNAITAFWNAQLQGTDKMARAFKQNPGRSFAKAVLGITVPSLLLWYAQKDDPYFQEIPAWRRILFWNFVTHNEDGSLKNIWSIPKPFEIGILFGSVPEMTLDWMKENDPKAFQDTGKAAFTALLPGFVPTAAIPAIESFANRSLFFDRPIVPRDKEELEPYLQAGPRTSEIVKLGSRMIKDVPGLKDFASPAKIQNLIVGWSGGMGRMTLDAADRIIKEFGVVKVVPEPTMTVDDLPGIRGFHARFPSANTRSIERFYDSYTENKKKWESNKEEIGVRGKGITLGLAGNLVLGMDPVLAYQEKAAKVLSLLRKSVDNTYKDPNIDSETKRVLIDNTYIRMINVARAGLKKEPIPNIPGSEIDLRSMLN